MIDNVTISGSMNADLEIKVESESVPETREEIAAMVFSREKTHCIRGHDLSGDNIVINGGVRMCRLCRNIRETEARQRRTTGAAAVGHVRPTHCKRGHEFTEENIYWIAGNRRGCRICRRLHRKNAQITHKPYIKTEWRRQNLKRYGLTEESYAVLLAKQNGVCAICLEKSKHSDGRPLYVDHCHKTGKVRGLLCNRCNSAIGLLDDSAFKLRRATNYILEGGITSDNANG